MVPGGINMEVEEDSGEFPHYFLLHQNIVNCVDNITLKVMYMIRRKLFMEISELKIGIKVKAILREDGKHIVVGEIINISLDNHPYRETFVQLNVSGGDVNDDQVHLMIRDNVNVTIPAVDVLGIY